jgi:hypothetical protein
VGLERVNRLPRVGAWWGTGAAMGEGVTAVPITGQLGFKTIPPILARVF